jgi:hypothetical protein
MLSSRFRFAERLIEALLRSGGGGGLKTPLVEAIAKGGWIGLAVAKFFRYLPSRRDRK